MIRYPNALEKIEEAVEGHKKGWIDRAQKRTAIFESLGHYTEEHTDASGRIKKLSPFWGDVKPLFMSRQHNKCVYCETQMEGGETATIQWDLEHFRPKGNVSKWPNNPHAQKYDFPTGERWPLGYYLLAYHLRNYAAACKTCNTPYKSDHFPIAAVRIGGKADPEEYAGEGPYLVYPLGTDDDDPENLIMFEGVKAVPKPDPTVDLHGWRRAVVMIDFLGLNRDGLQADRAKWLRYTVLLHIRMMLRGDTDHDVDWLISEQAPFSSCAKSFVDICEADFAAPNRMLPVLNMIIRDWETSQT